MLRRILRPRRALQHVNTASNNAFSVTEHHESKARDPRWQSRSLTTTRLVKSNNSDTNTPSPAPAPTSIKQAQHPNTNTQASPFPFPVQIPPTDPSTPHTTLQTFLTHAHQSSLSTQSTTYLGTLYEYLTQTHLQTHLSFQLTRVGGRNDTGIDLLGTWALPSILNQQMSPLRVLVQCKRLSSRAGGPHLIRELEGSFRGAPVDWRGDDVLGMMVCTRAATKGVRDAMGRSSRGLVWVMLEEEAVVGNELVGVSVEGETGQEQTYRVPGTRMRQFLYNAAAASKCGLEGVNVGMKYDESGSEQGVQLLWSGMPIDFPCA